MPRLGVGILLLTIAATSIAPAQVQSAADFCPLSVGNLWQYHYHYKHYSSTDSVSSYFTVTIPNDTVMPNAQHYFTVIGWGSMISYLRVDSSTANVYAYSSIDDSMPRDHFQDSLAANPGDIFFSSSREAKVYCTRLDSTQICGVLTMAKKFELGIWPPSTYTLARGLGLAQKVDSFDDGVWIDQYYSDLVYAQINGVEFGTLVDVKDRKPKLPKGAILAQNFPNPFNPSTTIRYTLPKQSRVTLVVYNSLGERVLTLIDREQPPGDHELRFDASSLASGLYFYRLTADNYLQTRKMVIAR